MKKLRLREVAQLTDFWNADLSVNLSYFEFNTLRVLCFFFTNWRFGAALRRAGLSAQFFQQHVLNVYLLHILVIPTILQNFFIFTVFVIVINEYVSLNAQ